MTTDITELAQRTDLLMDNALETAKQLRELSESTVADAIFESIVENENGKEIQFERPISDLAYAAFLKLERLVEALEKAQQRIDELENDEVRQRLANAEHQLYMAELAKHNLKASRKAQFRKRRAAEKRIAELESRTVTAAASDVLAERQRQVTAEGWTPEHDDEHCNGELAMAAVCYINETGTVNRNGGKPWGWPWAASWWKPNTRRRNMVKAGALILAEIERLDRATGTRGG